MILVTGTMSDDGDIEVRNIKDITWESRGLYRQGKRSCPSH